MLDGREEQLATFAQLYLSNEQSLRSYTRKLVQTATDADDVFQEASLTMLKKFSLAIAEENFGYWGRRVIHFKVLEHRRKRFREKLRFASKEICSLIVIDEEFESSTDLCTKLEHCLKRLTNSSRQIFWERYVQGEEVETIAVRHDRSVHAIYRSISRSRAIMQNAPR